MTANDELLLTATQQTDALRKHLVTPRDLLGRAIVTLESWQPTTNVYSRLWSDDARADAAGSTAQAAPLFGVPVLVKDSFDVRGYPTTSCCRAFPGNIADRDALLVQRLRSAGAIARTVDDVALAFAILDQNAPIDVDVTRLRFGRADTGYYGHRVHPDVRATLDAAAETLQATGMSRIDTTLPGVDEALPVWGDVAWPEFAEAYPNLDLERVGKQIADHYLYGKALPALRREAARA